MTSYAKKFTTEDLARFTDGFSENNFIGLTQFGELYRGKIPSENGKEAQDVTVKIWEDPPPEIYKVHPDEKLGRMRNEVYFLQHPKQYLHPRLVRVSGLCEDEKIGIVYDLKSLNTVSNLAVQESDRFSWLQRIKVAIEFARLLDFLHRRRHILVRNISPAHIMLDQEYCPRLIDFGMVSGGVLPDKRNIRQERIWGCHGYMDPDSAVPGEWCEKCDVFSFSGVLIGLISKRVFNDEDFSPDNFPVMDLYNWADEAYKPEKSASCFGQSSKSSLVHESLKADKGFYASDARKLSDLVLRCKMEYPSDVPTMKQVVQSLLKLRVVRKHAKELGLKKMVCGCNVMDFLPVCSCMVI